MQNIKALCGGAPGSVSLCGGGIPKNKSTLCGNKPRNTKSIVDHILDPKNSIALSEKIGLLDFDFIKKLIKAEYKIHDDVIDRMESKYRQFLFLSGKYETQTIVPDKETDIFWHKHILDTIKYHHDCMEIFGYFLHHNQGYGFEDGEKIMWERDFQLSQEFLRKEFPEVAANDDAYELKQIA